MNVIQSTLGLLLCLFLAGALVFTGYRCGSGNAGELSAEAEAHAARADSAEAVAADSSGAAARYRALYRSAGVERDSALVVAARAEADRDEAKRALVSADVRADEAADRFERTGDCDDCRAALQASRAARSEAGAVIASQDSVIAAKGAVIAIQARQLVHLEASAVADSAAAAALVYALAEQRLATAAESARADKATLQRNVLAVVAALLASIAVVK